MLYQDDAESIIAATGFNKDKDTGHYCFDVLSSPYETFVLDLLFIIF